MSQTRRRFDRAFLACAAVVAFLTIATPVSAVPVFARKYQTSCQTCHAIFPKLNPFGEAFRLNGYRFPAETEEQIKEKPVSLGAEGYKKIWPKAVYPGDLPGGVPFAFNVKMASIYESSHDAAGRTLVHNDFQFPQELNLFTAGTLGKNLSFLAEVTYEELPNGESELSIERAQLHVNSPFGREHAVNFKIGKFAPDLEDGFNEMWLMTGNGVDTVFDYDPIGFRGGTGIGEGGIGLPGLVQGIEFYGVASHRLFYTVGVTNGLGSPTGATFDGNSKKDWYGRIDYKWGGMGLDGDTTNVSLPAENWRERSLRVGLLGYLGNGSGIDFDVEDDAGTPFLMQDRRFERVGLYVSWLMRDLNVFAVALHGKDTLALFDPSTTAEIDETSRSYDAWFAQADYVIVPAFQFSLRYENLDPADPQADSAAFGNVNFSALIRANLKAFLEYRRDLHDSLNYSLATVLRYAY